MVSAAVAAARVLSSPYTVVHMTDEAPPMHQMNGRRASGVHPRSQACFACDIVAIFPLAGAR